MKVLKMSFGGSKQVLKKSEPKMESSSKTPFQKRAHRGAAEIWAKKSPTRGGSGKFQMLASLR